MTPSYLKFIPLLGIVVGLVLLGCGEDVTAPPANPGNQANDRVTITNEATTLESRVTYFDDEDVAIDAGGNKTPRKAAFSLKLVAEVLPPTIDGRVLQATSVDMKGNFAIVSYGMAGPDRLGGIDVFNITNRRRPRLESEALFNDTDVFAVAYASNSVYCAESTNDPTFEFPSVLEVLKLSGHNLVLDGNVRVGMRSFVTTSVAVGSTVFATDGNTGGLSAFDGTATETGFTQLADARWVDVSDGKVLVAQGMPGQLSVFDEATLSPLGAYSFDGADVPEAKTTVEVVGGKAFIGAGTAGLQVLSVNTGAVLGSIPRPDPAALGLDPAVVTTNSVSLDEELVFLSNGEAGVYVAEADQAFDSTGSEAVQSFTLLGQLQFGSLESVNHVAFKNDYLIVAAGLGGLKIVEIRR